MPEERLHLVSQRLPLRAGCAIGRRGIRRKPWLALPFHDVHQLQLRLTVLGQGERAP